MTESREVAPEAGAPEEAEGRQLRLPQGAFGVVLFGLGLAVGFLAAFVGVGLFAQVMNIVLAAFIVALFATALAGGALFVFRRPLMRHLFGLAEARLEEFAGPLGDVAQRAVERDPEGATAAARELVRLVLARYAWLTTRRWLVGSLTALIAAMAALAGTAMLFRQNLLLEEQIGLLQVQNERLTRQTLLAELGVELAEASRNGQLAVEITAIAEELGQLLDQRQGGGVQPGPDAIAVLDPMRDLGAGARLRIVAASKAARPYRFLDGVISPDDEAARLRAALSRRSGELPRAWAALAQAYGWSEAAGERSEIPRLIDRPASPERGLLLRTLLAAGVRQMEVLNFLGLDLSHAYAPSSRLFAVSFQLGRLAFADLSRSEIRGSDFGGAMLSGVRLRRARIGQTSFSAISGQAVKPPFAREGSYAADLMGADFTAAFVSDVRFDGARMIAADFDGAALVGASFAGAGLTAATFRGTALIDVDFSGAGLGKTDFDGALVAGRDALARIEAAAARGSFFASDYRLEPATLEEAFANEPLYLNIEADELEARLGDRGLYRVIRTAPLEPER